MRHYYSPSLIVTIVIVSSAFGFTVGRMTDDAAPQPGEPHTNAAPPLSSAGSATPPHTAKGNLPEPERGSPFTVAEWIARIVTTYPQKFDSASIRELTLRLKDDALLRQELIRRYEMEPDAQNRLRVIRALALSPMPDVVDFSLRLIERVDEVHRKNGFELQSSIPSTPEVYRAVTRALDVERSADVLRTAVTAMPPSMAISPQDTQAHIARLGQLALHPDAGVRAQSLRMLMMWDKSGKTASGALLRALTDTNAEVRQAGIGMVIAGQLRTDSVKTGLMSVANNKNEIPEIRLSALQALERFALSNEEYAAYSQARLETERLTQYTR